MTATILSLPFLPPIEWLAVYLQSQEVYIERHENFLKGRYLNRCEICGANGAMKLTVPLSGGRDHKMLYTETKIDYGSAWQRVHVNSIRSAYGSAPYFEFYMPYFEQLISRRHELLFDFNLELLKLVFKLLKCQPKHHFTSIYEKQPPHAFDFRVTSQFPKVELPRYYQVFEERHGFKAGLSVLDLLFHLGPESHQYLSTCRIG